MIHITIIRAGSASFRKGMIVQSWNTFLECVAGEITARRSHTWEVQKRNIRSVTHLRFSWKCFAHSAHGYTRDRASICSAAGSTNESNDSSPLCLMFRMTPNHLRAFLCQQQQIQSQAWLATVLTEYFSVMSTLHTILMHNTRHHRVPLNRCTLKQISFSWNSEALFQLKQKNNHIRSWHLPWNATPWLLKYAFVDPNSVVENSHAI